jgi:hypothetical protein
MVQGYTSELETLKANGGTSADVYGEVLAAIRKQRVPFPSKLPTHGAVIVDEARNVWIQDADPTGLAEGGIVPRAGSRWWTVKLADGRTIARVEMPDRFRVDGVGADVVYGVWRDEDDVEHVRVYALARKSGAR